MATPRNDPEGKKTEADLVRLLRARYAAPAWAFLEQVRNGTGFARRQVRTADGIAMSLFPSRGLHLHGFEVKVARYDWLRELEQPEKAEAIAAFVDFWWVVVSAADIVQAGELPATWGLLVSDGKKLAVKVEPKPLAPKPIDRLFVAAILRKAQQTIGPQAEIDAAVAAALVKERADRGEALSYGHKRDLEILEELRNTVSKFEAAAGVKITRWDHDRIGEAVRLVLQGGEAEARQRLRGLKKYAERILADCDRALAGVPDENEDAA